MASQSIIWLPSDGAYGPVALGDDATGDLVSGAQRTPAGQPEPVVYAGAQRAVIFEVGGFHEQFRWLVDWDHDGFAASRAFLRDYHRNIPVILGACANALQVIWSDGTIEYLKGCSRPIARLIEDNATSQLWEYTVLGRVWGDEPNL